ncbi:MAG TPA: energy-coupling factor ABC transporter permease [Methylophilaceae bacterium]|nr:energy-coupling factor ABC transporter permease [Methylophilaceae bacterium]
MNFPDFLLPTNLLWAANGLCFMLLFYCVKTAPWTTFKNQDLLNVFLGMCVALMLLWSIKAGIKPGLNFHLLGATLLSLMFGPQLAIVALTIVLAGITLFGMAGWQSFGINLLLMAALPALFSYAIFHWADRKLPNHLFIYIFIDSFACAAIAMALCGLAACYLLAESGAYSSEYLKHYYLPYFILMGWSEAILSGMAVTLMTAFKPHWLATFNDKRYLKVKN